MKKNIVRAMGHYTIDQVSQNEVKVTSLAYYIYYIKNIIIK